MALTATANGQVQQDVKNILGLQNCVSLKQSFNRPNLHYEIRPKKKSMVAEMAAYITLQPPGATGIIYANSRDGCEQLASKLREIHNLKAYHYHAGMPKNDRIATQLEWQENKFDIIVATVSDILFIFYLLKLNRIS